MKTKLALITLCLLVLPMAALAHGENEDVEAAIQARRQAVLEYKEQLQSELKAELTEARSQRIVARCEALKTNIEQKAQRIAAVKENRGQLVANYAARLEVFSARAQAASLNTEALNEDIASLKTLAGELDSLWGAYIEKLNVLASSECDAKADDFHAALEAAKLAQVDVSAKYKEIKDFTQAEIKHDLEHIRAELVEASSGQED